MRKEIWIGVAILAPIAFFADAVNREQVTRVLRNLAGGKTAMEKVAFVFPLVPHPTPTPTLPPLYPESVLFGEDVTLKYEDLGTGYWQTSGFNMVAGAPTSGDEDWQAHFRFKFNPPHDPLHPGHAIVAISGGRSRVRYAKLGKSDFYGYADVRKAAWIAVTAAEVPAVWGLAPGDSVALRIETDLSVPLRVATKDVEPESRTGTPAPTPPPVKIQKISYAKVFVRKLSHDTVRFDYVYQTDGKPLFPRPDLRAEGGI